MAERGSRRPARVIVVGAGGLGSYLGAVLAQSGHEVTLWARGEHARSIRTRGLVVRTEEGSWTAPLRCLDPGGHADAFDVVLVAVKAHALEEVAPAVADLSRSGATVVPLLNGVDAAERLEVGGVAADLIVDGVAYVTAFRTAPGEVERRGAHQRLVVGSSNGWSAHRAGAVAELFAGTPIRASVAEDVQVELWRKMAVVCALATVCGTTGSAIGAVRAHPFGPDLQRGVVREVLAVAEARGVRMPPGAEEAIAAVLDAFPPDFYPSVLHDLRSGRPTEMDALAGALGRMGRRLGVETPLLDLGACAVALAERASPPPAGNSTSATARPTASPSAT